MVANLSVTAKGLEAHRESHCDSARKAQKLKAELLDAVGADSRAYDEVVRALRLPKKTDEEKKARGAALAEANHRAASVPLSVLERTIVLLGLANLLP